MITDGDDGDELVVAAVIFWDSKVVTGEETTRWWGAESVTIYDVVVEEREI